MASQFWQKNIIYGVKRGWLAIALGFYSFLYFFYTFILTFSERSYDKRPFLTSLYGYLSSHWIDYSYKFLLSLPLVYFYFKIVKHWQFWVKFIMHILTCIAFVIVWQKLFYFTMESIGKGHLQGSAQVWDLYIPTLIYIIQFGFLHAFEYYYELQKERELAHKLRQAALQSELSAIKAQLNPHFLYNVFNSINASVPPEQERTREMIADLSDLFRYQLKASKQELIPLHEELDFVKKYLDLEKERFGDRLTIKMEIDDSLLYQKIPSLLIQPLVENSLKHGLASKIEGGEVSVCVKQEDDFLHFEVKDTGIGIKNFKILQNMKKQYTDKIGSEGVGLMNTQLRLEKLYDSTLHFKHNQPSGLHIYFSINKEKLQ